MDLVKALELAKGAIPAWDRMKEDQKRIRLFQQDWEEAFRIALEAKDAAKIAALLEVWPALAMKLPTGFSMDPFKGFRLLADDFARALNFLRYKARRKL